MWKLSTLLKRRLRMLRILYTVLKEWTGSFMDLSMRWSRVSWLTGSTDYLRCSASPKCNNLFRKLSGPGCRCLQLSQWLPTWWGVSHFACLVPMTALSLRNLWSMSSTLFSLQFSKLPTFSTSTWPTDRYLDRVKSWRTLVWTSMWSLLNLRSPTRTATDRGSRHPPCAGATQ